MKVLLNGETRELEADASVFDAVALAGVEPAARGVAVAVEGEVVTRTEWAGRRLREGESVEVVHAVQGG